jgi:hypothetical protein
LEDEVFYHAVDIINFTAHMALGLNRVHNIHLLCQLALKVEIYQSRRRNKIFQGIKKQTQGLLLLDGILTLRFFYQTVHNIQEHLESLEMAVGEDIYLIIRILLNNLIIIVVLLELKLLILFLGLLLLKNDVVS